MGFPADPWYGTERAYAPPGGPEWDDDEEEEEVFEMSVLQPAYAFRADNRSTGGWVHFIFNGQDRLIEMQEYDDEGDLVRRAGFLAEYDEDEDLDIEDFTEGYESEYEDPRDDPYVRAQLNQAMYALAAPEELAEAAFADVFETGGYITEKKGPKGAGSMRSMFAKMWDPESEEFDMPWAAEHRAEYARRYGLQVKMARDGLRVPAAGKKALELRRKKRQQSKGKGGKTGKRTGKRRDIAKMLGMTKTKPKKSKRKAAAESVTYGPRNLLTEDYDEYDLDEKKGPKGAGSMRSMFAKMFDPDSEEFDMPWAAKHRAEYARKYGLKIGPARDDGQRIAAKGKKKKRAALRKASKGKGGKTGKRLSKPRNIGKIARQRRKREAAESYFQDEIGSLERENATLRGLVSEMAVQHKMEELMRDHPELRRLEGRLAECKDVEVLEAEANALVHAIHEASGSAPLGTAATRKASVTSTATPGAPTGPLTESDGAPLDTLSESAEADTFSRAKAHRMRQREASQARASSLGE